MTRARSQPKLSEIGSRKTVKLSTRPRPSTDSAKHSASTFRAVQTGGFTVVSDAAESLSMATMERLFAAKNRCLARIRLCRPEQDVALLAKGHFDGPVPKIGRSKHLHNTFDGHVVDLYAS